MEARALLDDQERISGGLRAPTHEAEFWLGLREAKLGSRHRLLAWGESQSAVALQDHLAGLGLEIPVEELRVAEAPSRKSAIVPGFYVRDRSGRARCFPRGGSDISAVLLADRLLAPRVRFWKDGGGIRANGGVVSEVEASAVLLQFAGTVRPLHPAAVLLASRRGIEIVLEDPFGHHGSTRILTRAPARPTSSTSQLHANFGSVLAEQRTLGSTGAFR